MQAEYSKGMDYLEAVHRELLLPHKDNRRRVGDMAAITPNSPALLLVQAMRTYDEWLDTAYAEGKDDALVDSSTGIGYAPEMERARITYIVTGYRTLVYPAMGAYIERAYLNGYAAGMPVE